MDVSSASGHDPADTLPATVISGSQPVSPTRSTMRQALRDATLGEYEILNELGRGGMATVFLAHDISLDRKVAIKVMAPHLLEGEGMAERFKLEARTAAQLSHPHIIPIYAVKETADTLYFVMKFVEGRELGEVIKRSGQLPVPMVKDVLTKVGSALGYAHRRNVVHRDIKPANIMIDEEGTPVVTDFGIAKVAETSGLTMTGSTIGTPSYMSPEQCEAKTVTGASDQYSLGVVAFEMLTGSLPFAADSPVTIMYKHVHEDLPPLEDFRPDCPPEVLETVSRMLAKDPAERWPSMEAAIQKLRSATDSGMAAVVRGHDSDPTLPMASAGPSSSEAAGGRRGRSAVLAAAAIAAVVGVGVLATVRPWEADTPTSSEGQPATLDGTVGAGDQEASVAERDADPGADGAAGPGGESAPPPERETDGDPGDAGIDTDPETPPVESDVRRAATVSVAAVGITGAAGDLVPGQEVSLEVVARDASGGVVSRDTIDDCEVHGWTRCGVQWSSDDPSVATVRGDGTVVAVAPGVTAVRASVGGVDGQLPISVTALPVATVRLSSGDVTMRMGETRRLEAVAVASDGSVLDRSIEWSVDQPTYARIGSFDGVVEGLAPGTATVTARAGDQRATISVTVEAPDAASAVARLLSEYERAFESGDIDAVVRVVTGISSEMRTTVESSFDFMSEIDAVFGDTSLDDRGDSATLEVDAVYRFVADGDQMEAAATLLFELARTAGIWRIVGMDSR